MIQQWRWLFFVVTLLVLSGCTSQIYPVSSHVEECSTIAYRQSLISALASSDVQVIQVGDEVEVVVPTRELFYHNSSHLKYDPSPLLKTLIDLLNAYPMTSIKIAGYTSAKGNALRNLALSRQQAQIVNYYLWQHGLNARLIYAVGHGGENANGRGRTDRLEISFRMPAPVNVFN